MFGYKRTFAGKRRGYYSSGRYYGKYYRRGTIGRAAAGAAAAKRSDKTETYSCTVNGACSITIPADQNLSNVKVFHPYNGGLDTHGVPNDQANLVLGGAINDRGYRMKAACYDEVKLDSMKVTLSPSQIGANNNTSITICTMWDRKASPKECGFVTAAEWMANGSMPTATEIYNNEGTIKSIMTGNQIYGYKRYCRASSIIEKGGYHDSSILYNSTAAQSPLAYMYQDAWMKGPLAFCPALFMAVYTPISFNVDATAIFSYKVEYTFTFRNPKSDMDFFLVVESPGYVNPVADMVPDPNRQIIAKRSTPKELNDSFRMIYELNTASKLPAAEAKSKLESLFGATKKEETEDEMEVEDDHGTA